MTNPTYREAATERRLLCGLAFFCYSTSLISLAALAYSLFALSLGDAGQRIIGIYTRLVV